MIATDTDAAELTIRIEGPAVSAGRLAVDDLVLLARGLQDGIARVALVLSGVGSRRPGRRPAEVASRTRLEVVHFGPGGSAVLNLSLPRAHEPAQLKAFEPEQGADVGELAVELFLDGLSSIAGGGSLPTGWDAGVLTECWETLAIFERGVSRVEISGRGRRPDKSWDQHVVLDPPKRAIVKGLMRNPLRQRRTVQGRLSMGDFKETSLRCRVDPPIGASVECTFTEALRERVLRALTRHVTVTGEATLDPDSGRIRTLEIEEIDVIEFETARTDVRSFWEAPTIEELAAQQGVKPVTDVATLAADFWPSEMSVDDFLALIDDNEPRRTVPA